MDLKKRVVTITGASSRLSETTAMKPAAAGALIVKTDVTGPADNEKTVSKTPDDYGSIDVLINNTALMPLSRTNKNSKLLMEIP